MATQLLPFHIIQILPFYGNYKADQRSYISYHAITVIKISDPNIKGERLVFWLTVFDIAVSTSVTQCVRNGEKYTIKYLQTALTITVGALSGSLFTWRRQRQRHGARAELDLQRSHLVTYFLQADVILSRLHNFSKQYHCLGIKCSNILVHGGHLMYFTPRA